MPASRAVAGALAGVVLVLVTWGFDFYDDGRWNRISGFEDSATCWRIRDRMLNHHPDWTILECDED